MNTFHDRYSRLGAMAGVAIAILLFGLAFSSTSCMFGADKSPTTAATAPVGSSPFDVLRRDIVEVNSQLGALSGTLRNNSESLAKIIKNQEDIVKRLAAIEAKVK